MHAHNRARAWHGRLKADLNLKLIVSISVARIVYISRVICAGRGQYDTTDLLNIH